MFYKRWDSNKILSCLVLSICFVHFIYVFDSWTYWHTTFSTGLGNFGLTVVYFKGFLFMLRWTAHFLYFYWSLYFGAIFLLFFYAGHHFSIYWWTYWYVLDIILSLDLYSFLVFFILYSGQLYFSITNYTLIVQIFIILPRMTV